MTIARLCIKIVEWIKEKVKEAGARGGVFGLSGGVDSAVVGGLCKQALGNDVLALIMPCYNDPFDIQCARDVAKKFKINTRLIPLEPVYDKFKEILPSGNKLAQANLKPRLRMITLYYFANNLNYIVIGTGNKSELAVGYFTKYGDGGVDILPLGGILKTEVREIARYIGVPGYIIKKPPSAGLWNGQTDEEEMGITYEELDEIILHLEEGQKTSLAKENITRVKSMMEKAWHKKIPPPFFEKSKCSQN